MSAPEPSTPYFAAQLFTDALKDPDEYEAALWNLSTPESRDGRDYRAEAAVFPEDGDWGLATGGNRAPGAVDVAYIAILFGVGEGFRATVDWELTADAFLTLVWCPEAGIWLVHAVGAKVPPDALPRYSPGVAPS